VDKDEIIYRLWLILDDIDTWSDIAKSDNALYRAKVEGLQKLRWDVVNSDFVDQLYDKYYPKEMEDSQ
jgi:hypothetical protein